MQTSSVSWSRSWGVKVFKVLLCMSGEHDLRLVVLAAIFCMVASLTAFRLYARSLDSDGDARTVWTLLTGLAAGSAIWATHFIGMLAYRATLPTGYELTGTLLSLVIAILTTVVAFTVAALDGPYRKSTAGVLFGLGIAAMHFCGMDAFQVEGRLMWDGATVVASIILGTGLSVAAFYVNADGRDWRRLAVAAALLSLAICGMHFAAMSAVTIVPDPTLPVPVEALARDDIVIGVSLLAGLLLAGALCCLLFDLQGQRQSQDTMRLLFDACPVPMCLVDPRSLRFLAVNETAMRDYGYSREQFLGMTAYDLLAPDQHAEVRAIAAEGPKAYQGKRPWRHRRADGTELLVQAFIQPVPFQGRLALFVTMFNVTVREEAAEALARAKDAAEKASRAKGDFLANMSHEIRTPLNGVLAVVGALKRTVLDARQMEMAEIIETSGATLQRLLSDVLDMSKIEAGELDLEVRPFDLPALMRETSDLYASAALEKGLTYSLVIEPEARTWVEGDSCRIRQILGNLLSNAVKFTSAGKIGLYVAYAEQGGFRFVVSDTGAGFDAEFQGRMFQRFEQADTTVTRRFGGSGLGLAIAHDLAERMGGELRAESQPGRGSTFVLDLPLQPCAPPQTAPVLATTSAHPRASTGLKVLIADDHPVNRRVVELILGTLDVDLTAVENGLEAVEAYQAQRFDLVLMDMQMPVMGGLEAIRLIRANEVARGIAPVPIVVLSANAMPEHLAASRAAGATAHLAKPIQAGALLQTIMSVQAGSRLRGAA